MHEHRMDVLHGSYIEGADRRGDQAKKSLALVPAIVTQAFRSASRRVNEAIEAIQEPGMPLDMLTRWTRQAPPQALAVAFLAGVIATRRG
jgi:hypothetical protein